MNRRRVLKRFTLLGFGASAAYLGFKFYKIKSEPELEWLESYQDEIESLADLIIPRTDTPGAREASVGHFIVSMIKDCTDTMSQNNFLKGLKDILIDANHKFGREFLACSTEEQAVLLSKYAEADRSLSPFMLKVKRKLIGRSFFSILKDYTVLGYCTSEIGATSGLAYDYIPGRYQTNLILKPGQKAWATQ